MNILADGNKLIKGGGKKTDWAPFREAQYEIWGEKNPSANNHMLIHDTEMSTLQPSCRREASQAIQVPPRPVSSCAIIEDWGGGQGESVDWDVCLSLCVIKWVRVGVLCPGGMLTYRLVITDVRFVSSYGIKNWAISWSQWTDAETHHCD